MWAHRELWEGPHLLSDAIASYRAVFPNDLAKQRWLDKFGSVAAAHTDVEGVSLLHATATALTESSYEAALTAALDHGHAAAVMVGGLAGIRWGVEGIPGSWRAALTGKRFVAARLKPMLERQHALLRPPSEPIDDDSLRRKSLDEQVLEVFRPQGPALVARARTTTATVHEPFFCYSCESSEREGGWCARCEDEPLLDLRDADVRLLLDELDEARRRRAATVVTGTVGLLAFPIVPVAFFLVPLIGLPVGLGAWGLFVTAISDVVMSAVGPRPKRPAWPPPREGSEPTETPPLTP